MEEAIWIICKARAKSLGITPAQYRAKVSEQAIDAVKRSPPATNLNQFVAYIRGALPPSGDVIVGDW